MPLKTQSLDDLHKATLGMMDETNARKGKVIGCFFFRRQNNQRCTNQMPGKAQSLDDLDWATLTAMKKSNARKGKAIR